MRNCRICKQDKPYEFLKISKDNKAISHDGTGRIWHGGTCPDCFYKPKKPEKQVGDVFPTMCKSCGKLKTKQVSRIYKNGTIHYTDDDGKRWHGRTCGVCHNEAVRLSNENHLRNKNCTVCNKEYFPKVHHQKTCSEECRHRSQLKYKECKNCSKLFTFYDSGRKDYCSEECIKLSRSKIKLCIKCNSSQVSGRTKICDVCKVPKKKKYIKTCNYCEKEFETSNAGTKYCRKTHQPNHRKHKVFRRSIERCREQKISKLYKDEITKFYNNRPDNHHVDHIIPLKGENVCGLHVPWNLQYLPAHMNIKKSNKV